MRNNPWKPLLLCLALCGCSGHGNSASLTPATEITVESPPFPFQPPESAHVGDEPNQLAIADFNGDGAADLATANLASGNVTIATNASMSGNSSSLFGATSTVQVMEASASLAATDFDKDGDSDLVVLDRARESARFLPNGTTTGGAPSFALAGNMMIAGPTPWRVVAEDLNGDGHADIAASNDGHVLVLGSRNTGLRSLDPNFKPVRVQPDLTLDAAPAMGPLLSVDTDGDGKPELIAASMTQNEVLVFPNTSAPAGAISFGPPLAYGVGLYPIDMDCGDLDGDGKPEFVVANQSSQTVTVLFNQGGNAFSSTTIDTTQMMPVSIALVDIDGDGRSDLMLGDGIAKAIFVLLNQSSVGAVAFAEAWKAIPLGTTPDGICDADWNGDGKPDLVTTSRENDSVTVIASSP